MSSAAFPYEIKNVTEDEDKIIRKYYKGYIRPFIRIGPSGYLSPPRYQDHAADIYNLEVRNDDIWVCTFSRSGTTWLQELVWLINNNLDYATAKSVSLTRRYAFIEYPTVNAEVGRDPSQLSTRSATSATEQDFRNLPEMTSPRYVKTHLPLSLLPPNLTDVCKVFYVARHPLDVAVSFFFMHKMFRYFNEDVEFKEFWELFKRDLVMHLPIFPHVDEAWRRRNNPNFLFVFYEEMKKDLHEVIDRVCKFLGKEYSSQQKDQLAEYLDFDNMKKNNKISRSENEELQFLRKGKSGNWVNYFDEEMKKEAEEYLKEYFKNTDMRFPEV